MKKITFAGFCSLSLVFANHMRQTIRPTHCFFEIFCVIEPWHKSNHFAGFSWSPFRSFSQSIPRRPEEEAWAKVQRRSSSNTASLSLLPPSPVAVRQHLPRRPPPRAATAPPTPPIAGPPTRLETWCPSKRSIAQVNNVTC